MELSEPSSSAITKNGMRDMSGYSYPPPPTQPLAGQTQSRSLTSLYGVSLYVARVLRSRPDVIINYVSALGGQCVVCTRVIVDVDPAPVESRLDTVPGFADRRRASDSAVIMVVGPEVTVW